MASQDQHLLMLGMINVSFIASALFDERANTVKLVDKIDSPFSPDWVTRHPVHCDLVYAACREDWKGQICLIQVSPEGKLAIIDEADSGLSDPAAMEMLPDCSGIVAAHFLGGGVTVMPLSEDGRFQQPKRTHTFMPAYTPQTHKRQDAPHSHHVVVHQGEIIVPDQGSSRVWRLGYSPSQGLKLLGPIDHFEEADGPRHVALHPNGKFIYVLNETSSILSVHTFPPPGSDSSCLARVPMHPPSDAENALGAPMMSSEIILTNGNIVCTNRDSPNPEMDAIAIFAANDDGSLGTPSFIWPGMKHVRALSASPDDRFICVAGRDAGGLTVYDQRWNVRGRLDLDNVAIPVWME